MRQLPDGPCLLSPSGLIESLTREVILRKPEEFKIACLQDIRSLWPASHNPFYAGFGNRNSDVTAYQEAGVPLSRILVINPQGEIRLGGKIFPWASYPKLVQLSHEMFPALDTADHEPDDVDDFTAFNFWRAPLVELPAEPSEPDAPSLDAAHTLPHPIQPPSTSVPTLAPGPGPVETGNPREPRISLESPSSHDGIEDELD